MDNLHIRVFRLLLRLYPARFRDVYGDEMTAFFVQRLGRARGAGGAPAVAWLWFRSVTDIAKTAAAERRMSKKRSNNPWKGSSMVISLLNDVRYAARRLRHSPLFTLSAVAILAVGIGLNAAVFSLVDAILFRPVPFVNAEEIVHIYQDSDDGDPSSTSFPAYRDMAAMPEVFAGVAARSPAGATMETEEGPVRVSLDFVTASYFAVLGLEPSRGRWLSSEHDHVGSEMAAVVTHHTWRTRMGGDPDVVGRTIRLNNLPVTIIGIGPASFNGEAGALRTDLWLSISSTPVGGPFRVANLDRREDHWYQVKARLAAGVGVEQARAAMTGLAQHLAAEFPELNEGREITVFEHDEIRFHPDLDRALVPAGAGLLTVAGLILLLACSNLANLLLVRGIVRRPEMAVRLALGAGRARVVRLLLLEALLLSSLGAAAGLGLAAWSLQLVPSLPLPIPGAGGGLDVAFDHRVMTFGVLLALATGLLFGLVPALRCARGDLAAALREEGRGRSAGPGASLLRGGLVLVQVAVSIVLIVGAGLLTRSLANARRVDPGVDAGRIAVLGTNLQQGGVSDGEAAVVATQLLERVAAIPGVERAALTTRLPLQSGGTTTQIVDRYEPRTGTGSVELPFAVVSREYLETMGIPLLAGRGFTVDDRLGSPRVVVVNETAARLYWGGSAPGGRIRAQSSPDAWRTVVGVVADSKVSSFSEPPTPMIYYSAEQAGVSAFLVVARTAGDPAALLSPLRVALADVRSTLPVTQLAALDNMLGDTLAGARILTLLMGAFSLLALLLASLGVYAVVSFNVERRSQELGIRAALGAAQSRLVGAVVGESLVAVGLGVGVGLWLALLAVRGLEGLLFGVETFDALTFSVAALLLLGAAATAALLPALRVGRIDPVDVLRSG